MREQINFRNRGNAKLTLDEGFKKFITTKKAMKLSDRSIGFYEDCFRYFTAFCDPSTLTEDITKDTIIEYLVYINETKPTITDQTVASYMRGTRPFIRFLMEAGHTEKFDFPTVKKSEPLKETYTDDEINKLLVKPDIAKCYFAEYRNWVIICHMLATGNREGTVCNIKNCDVDFGSHEINLRVVKNRRAYIVPISSKYEKILKEYMSHRGGKPDDYLFCNVYQDPLTNNALRNSIQKYNSRRGVARTSIHAFRHTFAKKWVLNGGDIFRLQQMLGHSSLDMVKKRELSHIDR